MPRFFILFTDKEIRAYRAPVKQERMISMMDTIQENEIFNLADKVDYREGTFHPQAALRNDKAELFLMAVDAGVLRKGGLAYRCFKAVERFQYRQADIIGVQTPSNAPLVAKDTLGDARITVLHNWLSAPIPNTALPAPAPRGRSRRRRPRRHGQGCGGRRGSRRAPAPARS